MRTFICGFCFFLRKKPKFSNIQIDLSQRVFVERTSEKVRWNRQDLYFSKIKKLYILPQFPLVSGTIEEAFLSKFFKNSYFWDLDPSSTSPQTKGNWGRMNNFFIFEKYKSWRFQRTFSEVISPQSRWDRCISRFFWNYLSHVGTIFFDFSHIFVKKSKFSNIQIDHSQRIFIEMTSEKVR